MNVAKADSSSTSSSSNTTSNSSNSSNTQDPSAKLLKKHNKREDLEIIPETAELSADKTSAVENLVVVRNGE